MGRWCLIYKPSQEEITEAKRKRILKDLGKLLATHTIWCRSAMICREATPCRNLSCKYKVNRADIVRGCSQCQQFQLTYPSPNWITALHTHEFGDVIKSQ
jgi:hypothetical protein